MENEEESKNVRIFRLNYSGDLLESITESDEDYLNPFNINNIIAIHIKDQKRMYIWSGKHSTQSLKYYISKIRMITSREYSDLITLRYVNIDSGVEPDEFFNFTKISKEKLGEQLEYQEKIQSPKLSEITDLKNMSDEYFKSEEYDKVIEISTRLIQLAQEIGDPALEEDRQDFIKVAKEKNRLKQLTMSAEEYSEQIHEQFLELIKSEKIVEAHDLIEDFKARYGNDIDLQSIPTAAEMISKEEILWGELLKTNKFNQNIEELRKKGKDHLFDGNLTKALEYYEEIINQLKEFST